MKVSKFGVVLSGLLWSVYACTGILGIVSSLSPEGKDTCDATDGSCEEIDECSKCDKNAGCINNKGSNKCECNAGYEGNGYTCTDIDECSKLCNTYASCTNTEGSYECQCNTGYILAADGLTCIIDPCNSNTCKTPTTRCMKDVQDPKGYGCFCPTDLIGDNCQYQGPCVTEKPCVSGSCIQVDDLGKYTCDCLKGYVGFYCEFDDPCIVTPCHHEGICQSDPETGRFTCNCHTTGYIGPTCSNIDTCTNPSNPCKNGGLCTMDSIGNVVCICADGFKGVGCETAVTDCSGNPCNTGKCKVDDGKVKCSCGKNYTGEYCEIKVTCADHPCEHGGVCIADGESYNCSCGAGYSGSNCEIIDLPCGQDIFTDFEDQCASNICPSHCRTDTDGNALCFCEPGYTGDDCSIEVTECEDVVCLHGGSCVGNDGKFQCNCAPGYGGDNCENRVGVNPPDKKYFCPVVQTIGERGGCHKCSADVANCNGCCGEKETTCKANCQRLGKFCQLCQQGELNYPQCQAMKTKCEDPDSTTCDQTACSTKDPDSTTCDQTACSTKDPDSTTCDQTACSTKDPDSTTCDQTACSTKDQDSTACETACSTKAENCKKGCKAVGVKTDETKCPKVYTCPKEPTPNNAEVTGYQCQALKYPSGKIECVYKTVSVKKEDYHSYIMFPRINFAGKVQIDSATLNNVFSNFDVKTFAPRDTRITEENWNPSGSSNFRLVDVTVTRVCHDEGLCVYLTHNDPLAGAPIKGQANGKVAAKIVDLDIEVQGRLSEIYGLSIDVGGFFKGDMERASFQSLWYKMIDEPNDDYGQGSRFQSVLKNVQFSAKYSDSKIVNHLKENVGPNRQLSICFNIDLMGEHPAFNYSFARIVGSIGLAGEKAPHFFDYGRLLHRLPATRKLSYAPFTVDENKKKIYIDLGNTLAIGKNGDVLISVGQLALGVYADTAATDVVTPNCLDKITWISRIYYNEYGGYTFTAGISTIDIPSHLEGKLNKQFVLAKIDEGGACLNILLAENKEGINVRSNSHFVFRAQYEDVIYGNLFVAIFGKKPTTSQDINLKLETADSIIRDHPLGPAQPFGLFKDTVDPSIYNYYFYAMHNPNNIRKIIDGQIYALQYTFNGYPLNPDRNEAMNTAICIHVYDEITPSDQPTWVTDILPIFQLYANLFPVMRSFVDLGDYNSVVEKKCHILTAMSLDFQDPQFMPVTRDLSPNKTEMILKWLDEDKPEFGLTHHAQLLTKQHLLNMLQTALELEHATIPIYMNGFLSIKPWQNEEVKKMLHQIIVDEMFHFAQVANIINGLGGRPYLLGNTFVPAFPSHLPGGCRPNMIASINKISSQQVHDVYMEIEEPSYVLKDHELVALINKISSAHLKTILESSEGGGGYPEICAEALALFPLPNKKLTETNHETIGDFYMSVVYILGQLSICGKKDIFTGKTKQLKWSDPEHLREVNNYDSALKAIKAIVDQGEGASPYNPLQQNVDSSELSHYFKFSSIFHGRQITTFNVTNEKVYNNNEQECHENYVYLGDKISFFETGVWPVVNDPQMSKYKPDSQAYKNAQAFNDIYRKLLETMQSVFDGNVDRFDDTFGLMKSLIVYGMRVVQTPIDEDGDPNIGPNAGPTYFN